MTAIEAKNVGKCYQQIEERSTVLGALLPFLRSRSTPFWAVSGLDLKVEEGEVVGILGRNGAGKTTLLRLLAGITRPSTGSVTIRGRVAPLIGVGIGFHPEMTGRENVFVNGMLLGLGRRLLESRFDQIVEFAELADHIDTPVKFYSSGMYMRLGFSVAAHVDPDILLADEVLAVGDTAFQLKCFERMRELRARGTTILLVSHSLHAIRLLCPRALLIRGGHLEIDGPAEDVIARYHELLSTEVHESGNQVARIVNRRLVGGGGSTHHPRKDESIRYEVEVEFTGDVEDPQFTFQVIGEDGTVVYQIVSEFGRAEHRYPAGSAATFTVHFVNRLMGGTYTLRSAVTDRSARETYAYDSAGYSVYVDPAPGVGGFADLKAAITLDGTAISQHTGLLLSAPASNQDGARSDHIDLDVSQIGDDRP